MQALSGDDDHPELLYRSDCLTTPCSSPPVDSATPQSNHSVEFSTPNSIPSGTQSIWKEIEMETQGSLGLVVIWIGVYQAGSTSPDLAHEVSQDILGLLSKNGVRVVVEWSQGRRCGMERSSPADVGRELSLGIPATKVFRVSNCHVLRMRRNATVDYKYKDGTPMDHVRVCGAHRFQRGLDEICKGTRRQLEEENEDVAELEDLYNEIENDWSQNRLSRNTGHVQYAPAIPVDSEGGTYYTSDWAAFLTFKEKVKPHFQGNVVTYCTLGWSLLAQIKAKFEYADFHRTTW
ncbi:hypothetical protein EV360DRAFT_83354 [Lentinula raphanica]|nr:hypothetical protein EV360DRAFT_83354 [Lentinula raphanica]